LNPVRLHSGSAQRSHAIRMLIVSTLFWALSFPAMKALLLTQQRLLPEAESGFFAALGVLYRFALAGLILLPFVFHQVRTATWRELEQALIIACFGGNGIIFQMDGLAYTSGSTSAFLTQGYCVFIPLWVALVNRRWPGLKVVLSVALVVGGVGILAGVNLHSFKLGRGEWETLIASLLFTGQILTLEHPRYALNRPLCLTVLMLLATAVVAAPLTIIAAPSLAACWQAYASPAAGGFLAVIVLFCTLAAFLLMNTWQKQVTATEAGLIYCCEPVFASLMVLFMPELFSHWAGISYANENLTGRLLLGGGLITVANVLLQSRWLKPKPSTAALE
jgi:drug/metabolite transporter (DMT)-like permease